MADTDYLAASDGTGNAALMHITSPRTALATVIQVDTVSGVPAFFIGTWGTLGADGFITAASARDFFGHVSAGTLVIDKMAPGNVDGGNTSGQVVVIKPSTPAQNTISNAIKAGSAFPAQFANFVEPGGGVWTVSSGLIGQMSAGFVWLAGARTAISAIASHTFGASLDTYVDINPSTGVATYVPVANGAAEPAVTAASVRVAKVITGGAAISLITYSNYTQPMRVNENEFNYIAFGCKWTADAAGSTLLATMTPGVVYINGKRLTVAGVTSRAFSASVDTYVDFQDNLDGTAKIVYTTATNNTVSPAIPNSLDETNNVRNAIVVSGATNIAAATSINQGQEDRILPTVSSAAYSVADGQGNLICPRDPNRRVVGYKQVVADITIATATTTAIAALSAPIIIPNGTRIKVTFQSPATRNDNVSGQTVLGLHEGAVSGATNQKHQGYYDQAVASKYIPMHVEGVWTPASGNPTINGSYQTNGTGTSTLSSATIRPIYMLIERA